MCILSLKTFLLFSLEKTHTLNFRVPMKVLLGTSSFTPCLCVSECLHEHWSCIMCSNSKVFHLPGLVRAPRALLVVERGFALVLVAEVWAAAAAAASVARFCNCKAFMPAEEREK